MRLFTGLTVPPHLFANLKRISGPQWSPETNLHITTRFIGAWPESRLDELRLALAKVPKPGEIAVAITGYGFFPHVFYAAVRPDEVLNRLARDTELALEPLGIPREPRPWSPHVTLARGKVAGLRDTIASMNDFPGAHFAASEFHLYESRPGRSGSAYTKIASYPLA